MVLIALFYCIAVRGQRCTLYVLDCLSAAAINYLEQLLIVGGDSVFCNCKTYKSNA